ncbi:MAG: hypothetical protein U9Q12_00035 [Patescibacteria group bacterium]|nr:hypothetical protein [Patescibacteria group bacterium]
MRVVYPEIGGRKESIKINGAGVIYILEEMCPPKVKKANTEYAVVIRLGSVCIFRVNIGEQPRLIEGSMLVQIEKGSLKIGFVDIHDEKIENSICEVIRGFWHIVSEDANAECAVVHSPRKRISSL